MIQIVVVYVIFALLMSLITFVFFAKDKKASGNEANGRIPEIVLLSLTTFGGALGAMAGMYGLRHKTNFNTKFHFAITTWMSCIAQIAILILFCITSA